MLHLYVRPLMLSTFISLAFGAAAETSENFNSRKGIPIQNIKSTLQNSCWSFHHFDVNANGWNPGIEGDGAMVATADAAQFSNSGIYTPVLNIGENLTVSFEYIFNNNFSGSPEKWLKLCLATANNEIVQVLETIPFNGVNATQKKKFSTQYRLLPAGEYRLVLQYGGSGGTALIAIDELKISAPYKYPGGCNSSPVAVKDRITGMINRSASGSLLQNDKDVNNEKLTAYLIKGSSDGKVILNENGSFTFTPDKSFKRNYTSFTYKICDNGAVNLCSENTIVRINFPEAPRIALNLVDFRGSYRYNGNVELGWKTHTAAAGQKFEIERSADGHTWANTGSVPGETEARTYTFVDRLSRNRVQKNDLYYRLRQIDSNGASVISRLLIVRVYNTRTLTMISVTPNPAKNDISVNVQLQENAYVSMRVLDNAGISVMHKITHAEKGMNNFMIEGSSRLKPGAYSLEVIVNSRERMVIKLIKE
jgi:hypothetical protein